MSRKIYDKLIRDRIPEVIKSKGHIPKFSIMNDSDFREALKNKMVEEAKELTEAKTKEDVLNELSDIQELVMAIAKNYEFNMDEIEKKRKKKLQERGGFEKRFLLECVDEQ